VRDATRKLPDGLKLLRLPQLALHGPKLGHVFSDDFDGPGMIGDREKAHVKTHGHDASIAPPPFAFGAVELALFATRSH